MEFVNHGNQFSGGRTRPCLNYSLFRIFHSSRPPRRSQERVRLRLTDAFLTRNDQRLGCKKNGYPYHYHPYDHSPCQKQTPFFSLFLFIYIHSYIHYPVILSSVSFICHYSSLLSQCPLHHIYPSIISDCVSYCKPVPSLHR